jgi:hypothetical protein
MLIQLPGIAATPAEATEMLWNAYEEHLAGLKIRVPGAVMGKTVEALGATPVAMPAPEMYNALATGVVDGLLVGPCVIPAFKIGEVANYFTIGLPLGVAPFFLVMNQAGAGRGRGGRPAGAPDPRCHEIRELRRAHVRLVGWCAPNRRRCLRAP